MKQYLKYLIITLFIAAGLSACKKGEPVYSAVTTPVSLTLQGFILDDTLEIVVKDKVICTAFDNSFIMKGNLFTAGTEMIIRKKKDGKQVGQFNLDAAPYYQTKKIFFDGTAIRDKIVLDPVSSPDHMGFKVRFQTTFIDFYGGPVDIQLYDQAVDNNTYDYTLTPIRLISNVKASYGGFVEISVPANTDAITHFLLFKVFKTGTTQLPYTSTDNLSISDPDNNYGPLDYIKGSSQLLTISPSLYINSDKPNAVGDGYSIVALTSQ